MYRREIISRFSSLAGGRRTLNALHTAFYTGAAISLQTTLEQIMMASASSFDLTGENSMHMFVLGLVYGMPGYHDPESNREHGLGRPDIRLEPEKSSLPLITIELKYLDPEAPQEELEPTAHTALAQIADKRYDEDVPSGITQRLRWDIATSGKRCCVACTSD